jgi:hypothetical protein
VFSIRSSIRVSRMMPKTLRASGNLRASATGPA